MNNFNKFYEVFVKIYERHCKSTYWSVLIFSTSFWRIFNVCLILGIYKLERVWVNSFNKFHEVFVKIYERHCKSTYRSFLIFSTSFWRIFNVFLILGIYKLERVWVNSFDKFHEVFVKIHERHCKSTYWSFLIFSTSFWRIFNVFLTRLGIYKLEWVWMDSFNEFSIFMDFRKANKTIQIKMLIIFWYVVLISFRRLSGIFFLWFFFKMLKNEHIISSCNFILRQIQQKPLFCRREK